MGAGLSLMPQQRSPGDLAAVAAWVGQHETAVLLHAVSQFVLPRARKAWTLSVGRQSRSIAARSPRQPAPAAGSRHPASRLIGSSPKGHKVELHDPAWQPCPPAQPAA